MTTPEDDQTDVHTPVVTQNNQSLAPTSLEDSLQGRIKQSADELHALVLATQTDLITALTKDKDKLSDTKHARVLSEVLNSATATALGTKKIAIDAQSNDQQKAMVALMISMAKNEAPTMQYVASVVNQKAQQPTEVIDVAVKGFEFDERTIKQGIEHINFNELTGEP